MIWIMRINDSSAVGRAVHFGTERRRLAGATALGLGLGQAMVVRIAAIGDLHLSRRVPFALVHEFATLHERADVLVVAGDITNSGLVRQALLAADLFRRVRIPIVAVLGNHDRRALLRRQFRRTLTGAGAILLEGATVQIERGVRIGFAGVGGSGGGFWPDEGPQLPYNRPFQALAIRARREAARLDAALCTLDADVTVVVTHFAPTATTLGKEPLLKYPLLGNIELGRVIDRHHVDLVIHGHAHHGNTYGYTAGGTPVRNVAVDIVGGLTVHELAAPEPRLIAQSGWSAYTSGQCA